MRLSDNCLQKLKYWLAGDTWHTLHNADMDQWYDFVDQYQRDHGFYIDEHALRDQIASLAGCIGNEHLVRVISKRISLAYNILDLLKRTRR
jgi:hypothetical protein